MLQVVKAGLTEVRKLCRPRRTVLVSPAGPCPRVTPQTLEGCVGSCLHVSCGPRWAEQRLRPISAVLTAAPGCSTHSACTAPVRPGSARPGSWYEGSVCQVLGAGQLSCLSVADLQTRATAVLASLQHYLRKPEVTKHLQIRALRTVPGSH